MSRPRTVLIVDDSPEDRAAHRRYLERAEDAEYDIVEAELGEVGLALCAERAPDCVLLDFSLPDMQGFEFLLRLREMELGSAVVMLTGAWNEGMAIQALKSGAHDYLVKGRVTRDGLRIAIDSAIEKASLQRQVQETQARLKTALDTMLDCFAILSAIRDADGNVVDFRLEYANDQACAESGRERSAVLGKRLSAVFSSHRPQLFPEYVRVVETGEPFIREVVQHDPDDPSTYPELLQAWDVRVTKLDDGVAVAWRDITEHKSAESYVYRMNQILETRVEERTRALQDTIGELEGFTYTVAHDLRAPLRAIIASSRIILEEAAERLVPEHRALLDRQATNARRLGDLIDDLLKLSRISRQELKKDRIDLSAMALDIASGLPTGTFDVEPGIVVWGDGILLRLALVNLMENAAKFSPMGGTIHVGGYEDDGRSVFFVKDEGIGFDMQYAHKLFAPFERLHRESDFPGTGIGLANVHRIAQRHNGSVWAESSPGHGAKFYLALPQP